MTQKIALFRGVNVGGHNRLPMKELARILEANGCKNVRTYIQSGNVVYEGTASDAAIGAAIETNFGFCPQMFILTACALKKIAADCPYQKQAKKDPKSVHLSFLESAPPKNAAEEFDKIKTSAEEFSIIGKVLYLHSPKGLSASKIAEKADRILKVKTTSRNWNTIEALLDLCNKAA